MRFMSAISVVNTMTSRFWRQSEQPINNQLATINRLRECAAHLGICRFTCPTWPHCERRLTISRSSMLIWKIRATRSVRKPPAHPYGSLVSRSRWLSLGVVSARGKVI